MISEEMVERDAALAAIERVRALHRPVEIEPSDTICGECSFQLPNKRFFGKLTEYPCPTLDALDGAPEPEWEYGYELIEPDSRDVFEREGDFRSAEFAHRAAKKRIHEERHPDVPTLKYSIIRRGKAGAWEPVEGGDEE